MSELRRALAIGRADALRLVRDRFLVGTGLYILGISVVMRWVIPWATGGVASRWDFDLTPYHPLIVSHFVVQLAPLLVGIVGAFLLLESREDGTIKALLVSPLPIRAYLWWACCMMVAASLALVLVEASIIGHALPSWPALTASGFAGGMAAPMIAFAVAAVAGNKTEAFAYLKILGVAPLLVSGSYLLAEPLQWVAAIYPPYLAVKAYWIAERGATSWPLWIVGGVVTSSAWTALTAHMFTRAARR